MGTYAGKFSFRAAAATGAGVGGGGAAVGGGGGAAGAGAWVGTGGCVGGNAVDGAGAGATQASSNAERPNVLTLANRKNVRLSMCPSLIRGSPESSRQRDD